MKPETVLRVLPLALCCVLAAFAAAWRGWRPAAPSQGTGGVVARVGDRVLTSSEADRLAEELVPDEAAALPALPAEAQSARREEAIRAWVCEELLCQEGLRRGVHLDDPVVRRRVADRVYEEDVSSLSVAEPVGEDEARELYAARPEEFVRAAQVLGVHVVLRFPERIPASEREARTSDVRAALDCGIAALEPVLTRCEQDGVEVRIPAAMDREQTEEQVARAFTRRVARAYFSEECSRRAVAVEAEDGVHLMRAMKSMPSAPIPFDECRVQVEDAVRRARSDERYRRLLRGLATRPGVDVPPGLWKD